MKKYLCLVLCVVLAAAILVGCGASETPAPAQTPAPAETPEPDTDGTLDEVPVSLWNQSDAVFVSFAMKPSDNEEWTDDWDAQLELHKDESYEIWLGITEDEIVHYDIELIDANGDFWSLLEVPLGQGSELLVFDEESAWVGAVNGDTADIEVIFTNTENDEDYLGPVGVWEVRVGDADPSGEMELLEDGTLITRDNAGGEVFSTYSLEGDVITLHYDGFDLTCRVEGDIIYTQAGSEYAFRK